MFTNRNGAKKVILSKFDAISFDPIAIQIACTSDSFKT